MLLGLHAGSIMHTNVATDVRIAQDLGFDTLELWIPKVERYLDAGYTAEDLDSLVGSMPVAMLNCVLYVERQEPEFRRKLRRRCKGLCEVAQTIGCPRLQVIVLDALKGEPWPDVRKKTAASLAELADIASPFGVELVMEPVSFSPLHTVGEALEVFQAAERDNLKLCLDTFHLWAGGTPWSEVAALDPSYIAVAHLSDATPRDDGNYSDEDRDVLPGDGVLPLQEAVEAIRATGYDGLWSVELLGDYYWEWDPINLARELKQRTEALLLG